MRADINITTSPLTSMPPAFQGVVEGEKWQDYLLASIEHYPQTVSMNLSDVTWTDLEEWVGGSSVVRDDGATTDEIVRDFVHHFLGLPKVVQS